MITHFPRRSKHDGELTVEEYERIEKLPEWARMIIYRLNICLGQTQANYEIRTQEVKELEERLKK